MTHYYLGIDVAKANTTVHYGCLTENSGAKSSPIPPTALPNSSVGWPRTKRLPFMSAWKQPVFTGKSPPNFLL